MGSPFKGRLLAALRTSSILKGTPMLASVRGLPERPAPELLLEADFENGVYTLNGETVTFGDIFNTTTSDATPIAGVGMQVDKPLGTGATGYYATLYFTDAVRALLNTEAGFMAVVDSITENPAYGVEPFNSAHPGCGAEIMLADADYNHYKRARTSFHGASTQLLDHHRSLFSVMTEQATDGGYTKYDYSEPWDIQGADFGVLNRTYMNVGRTISAYYEANPGKAAVSENLILADVPMPDPALVNAFFTMSASAHEGPTTDKDLVSIRLTVPKLSIYTNAQNPGFTFPVEPVAAAAAVADFVNDVFMIGDTPVAWTDMFTPHALTKTDGVGLQQIRPTGVGTNYYGWVDFSPALVAALGTDYTAELHYDFARTDNGGSYAIPNLQLTTNSLSGNVWRYALAGVRSGGLEYLNAGCYDYDLVTPEYDYDYQEGVLPGFQNDGTAILTVGANIRAYFGEDLSLVAEKAPAEPVAHPADGAQRLYLNNRADPASGTDYLGVACTNTLKKVVFHKPPKPSGWVPAD